MYRNDPVARKCIEHEDRFSENTDKLAEEKFNKIKDKKYSYIRYANERVGVGSPIDYRYSVNWRGEVVLALKFKGLHFEVWDVDPLLEERVPPKVEKINRVGKTLVGKSGQEFLFDGVFEEFGDVWYISSDFDKAMGGKYIHREREITWIE